MKKITNILLILILVTINANAVSSRYIYSATQHSNSVDVRLIAPENGLLCLGVYDNYTHQMKDVTLQETGIILNTQVVTVNLKRTPLSTEHVEAFLLDKETYAPLCAAVLADIVIPSNNPDPDPDPEPEPEPEPEPVASKYNYVLNTNSKIFHYPTCASAKRISSKNRQDYYGKREDVIAMGYTPCKTCHP